MLRSDFTPTTHHDTYPAIEPSTKSDLTGRYIFVTGASKGIGRSTSLAYAKAGAAAIAIGARSALSSLEKEIQDAATRAGKALPKVLSIKLDVEDRASIENAAKEIESHFGKLDILINNAGYLESFTPIADSDPDEWWKTWTVNIRGPYLLTRSLLPLLFKSPSKQILNLSSIGAHATMSGASAYQTTKLAIIRFSEFINAEYGSQGVISYAVHPGGVMTELAVNMPKEAHGLLIDQPELAGDTIVWLTQQRREWLAGRYVSCTWDMPELIKMEDEIVQKGLLKVRMVL
ncbi:MAG: hypothetical protein Q9164_006242 [Protoblastenia rupestris]